MTDEGQGSERFHVCKHDPTYKRKPNYKETPGWFRECKNFPGYYEAVNDVTRNKYLADWNKAMTDKYDAVYDVVESIFPNARIEWYARGAIHPDSDPTGWKERPYFNLDEKGKSFSCSLYRVPEIGYTRETFRRTYENAKVKGIAQVTPWIALASGFRRETIRYHAFSNDWNYDLIYSWQLGAEINEAKSQTLYKISQGKDYVPWNAAKIAVFFPAPFSDPPFWGIHFVAYVRGANQIKELPVVEMKK